MSLLIRGEFMVMEGHASATKRAAYLVPTLLGNFGVVGGMCGLCGAVRTQCFPNFTHSVFWMMFRVRAIFSKGGCWMHLSLSILWWYNLCIAPTPLYILRVQCIQLEILSSVEGRHWR